MIAALGWIIPEYFRSAFRFDDDLIVVVEVVDVLQFVC